MTLTHPDPFSFKLTNEAKADMRCTQLHYFLKPHASKANKTQHEMTYVNTTWDAGNDNIFVGCTDVHSAAFDKIRRGTIDQSVVYRTERRR